MEIFVPIKNFENLYHVSNFGRVKSFVKDLNGVIIRKELIVKLYKNKIQTNIPLAEIVYLHHSKYANAYTDINKLTYIDHDKKNCNIDNLFYKHDIKLVCVYYDNVDGLINCYNDEQQYWIDSTPNYKKYNCFHMTSQSGFNANNDGLKQYYDYLIQQSNELMSDANNIYKIDYLKNSSHFNSVEHCIKHLINKPLFDKLEHITAKEMEIQNMTPTGSIQCLNPNFENVTIHAVSYDFNLNYVANMASHDLKIPIKTFKEYTLEELNMDDIQLGYYKCLITSNCPYVKMMFLFSKNACYTDISIMHAILLLDAGFEINIELLNESPNCFLYDEYVTGDQLFGNYYNTFKSLRKRFPKNSLLKHLSSSAWGTITRQNLTRLTIDEFETSDKIETHELVNVIQKNDNTQICEVLNKTHVQFMPIRLKANLTSLCRYNLCKFALQHDPSLQSVIRCHTDSVVFSSNINVDLLPYGDTLKIETKYCGYLCFMNLNTCYNYCNNCNLHFKKYDEFKNHICVI